MHADQLKLNGTARVFNKRCVAAKMATYHASLFDGVLICHSADLWLAHAEATSGNASSEIIMSHEGSPQWQLFIREMPKSAASMKIQ